MKIYTGAGTEIQMATASGGNLDVLNGCSWLPIGDSITNNGSYRLPIAEECGLTVKTGGYNDGWQAGYASGSSYCVVEKVPSLSSTKPDIVTICLGTNDYGANCPLGELNDGLYSSSNYSFYGCYQRIIELLFAKYDKVPILLITPFQRNGGNTKNSTNHNLKDYVDAIKTIGSYYSIPVCDVYSYGGVPIGTMTDTGSLGYYYTEDGLHLNSIAGGIVGLKIAEDMAYTLNRWNIPCTSLTPYSGGSYVSVPNVSVGGTARLYITRSPVYSTDRAVWTSSNPNIATVSSGGNYAAATVTGVSVGTCDIVVTCGSITYTYHCTVS